MHKPPLGRLVPVADHHLFLHTSGTGGPTVVFLPGAGLVGLDFLNVQQLAADLATSAVYDRAGTGWSTPADLPRTATEVATELRALLHTASLPGPFVLVGHSLGAFYARRYAQLFPTEVAGLLLLDPGHEDMLTYLPPQAAELNNRMKQAAQDMPDLTDDQLTASRTALTTLYATWPAEVLPPLVEHHLTAWRTGLAEAANMDTTVYDELRHGTPLPDVPLTVLTATGRNAYWSQFADEHLVQAAQTGLHAMHAAIASSVPRGQHRTVDNASHQYLTIEQPDAVITALADLLKNC
ncbi:alpha/beta fold hydrolase [Umezawaea tangerina]|uniref:Pimeloyl-ACP methyl ester carboxylesterase n=1 Tax=Umezawaea tangerina TaxID=84725 RepID=A0A2T0TM97_9PSEU|nr:alpha/beta hydrolase [Umezawaea tangerina]PRY46741.1 pimeloyl-ACP methyl ester carboxylesterase [Umezawaea tangerina]